MNPEDRSLAIVVSVAVFVCVIGIVIVLFSPPIQNNVPPNTRIIPSQITVAHWGFTIFNTQELDGSIKLIITDTSDKHYYYYYKHNVIPVIGSTYMITYYCNSDNDRQILSMDDITVYPDPAKCQTINGVCQ